MGLRHGTLPLVLPGILVGAVLAFARSLGEFGATITFVENIPGETQTLPSALYTFTHVPGGDAGALRLSLIRSRVSMLALLVAEVVAPADRPADQWRVSLDLAVAHRLGAFSLDVAFRAETGLTALFGPSGSGKTTVVNVIAGLVRPDHGAGGGQRRTSRRYGPAHVRSAPPPPHRLRLPGAAPLPAPHCSPELALRLVVHSARPARGPARAGPRPPRPGRPARPTPGRSLGRGETARRDRTRVARQSPPTC